MLSLPSKYVFNYFMSYCLAPTTTKWASWRAEILSILFIDVFAAVGVQQTFAKVTDEWINGWKFSWLPVGHCCHLFQNWKASSPAPTRRNDLRHNDSQVFWEAGRIKLLAFQRRNLGREAEWRTSQSIATVHNPSMLVFHSSYNPSKLVFHSSLKLSWNSSTHCLEGKLLTK